MVMLAQRPLALCNVMTKCATIPYTVFASFFPIRLLPVLWNIVYSHVCIRTEAAREAAVCGVMTNYAPHSFLLT